MKKAQNAGGINYSQVMFAVDRELSEVELENIKKMSDQVKALAMKVTVLDEE